jgi:outer membrane lipoprotein SlyB
MKLYTNFSLIFAALATSIIIGCASTDGVGRYRIQSIGNAQRSVLAEVLSTREVFIMEQTSGSGATFGGAVGGGLAADGSDNLAVIIAGVIAGALVGEYVEGQANVHNATEYVIKTSNEILLTVAQINDNQEVFIKGDKVVLVYGYPNRLISAPN